MGTSVILSHPKFSEFLPAQNHLFLSASLKITCLVLFIVCFFFHFFFISFFSHLPPSSPVGDEDTEVVVQVCNVMVCTTFDQSLSLSVCVPEQRDELFEETFLTVCDFDFYCLIFPFPFFLGNIFTFMLFSLFIINRLKKKFNKINWKVPWQRCWQLESPLITVKNFLMS